MPHRHRFQPPLALALAIQALSISSMATASTPLEEVVVTAQKREQNLQEVPISISALTSTSIENRGINNTRDLISTLPNLSGLESPDKRGSVAIAIRGISNGSTNISFDPANAIYIDGVYLGKTAGSALDVVDLERIEVLRGPQGTLYGRNATGGAINFISKKPSGELRGKVTATAGNYDLWGINASLDLPSIGTENTGAGTLASSVAYQQRQRDPLYDNTNPAYKGFESIDREAWRIALRWQPNDSITADYSYDRSDLDELGSLQHPIGFTQMTLDGMSRLEVLDGYLRAAQYAGMGVGPLAGAVNAPGFSRWVESVGIAREQMAGIGSKSRPSRGSNDLNGNVSNTTEGHALTLAWDLGDVTLKSVTALRSVELRALANLDGTDNSLSPSGAGFINDSTLGALFGLYRAGQAGAAALAWDAIDRFGGGFASSDGSVEYRQRSQEFQLVGNTDSLEYVAGLYYFEDEGESRGVSAYAAPVGGFNSRSFDNSTEAWAAFAQATYRPQMFDQKLAITAGLRHTEETKDVTYLYRSSGSPFQPANGVYPYNGELVRSAIYGNKEEREFDNVSGLFNIAYQLTDDLNLYASYSTGFRSGGLNGDVPGNDFDEETIQQYEIGLKSDWLKGRLRVNTSLFQYDYEDQQLAQLSTSATGEVSTRIENAGKSKRWGAEIELVAAPSDDLLINATYGYLHGDYEEFASYCTPAGCLANTDSLAERAQSPGNQLGLTVDYTVARWDAAALTVNLAANWQSASSASALWTGQYRDSTGQSVVIAYPSLKIDERTVVDARVSLEDIRAGDGNIRISLWSKNLFDQDYNTMAINYASLGPITRNFGEPRTYGLDLRYEF